MDRDAATVETVMLDCLWVPWTLVDLVEKWAKRTREEPSNVLRSILNLGLARYAEMYPQSVPQLAKAMEDLEAMAPKGAKRFRLDAVERADGQLTLRCAESDEPDTVKIEVHAQPKLAALLKAHALRWNAAVGNMLLELWCIETLTHYSTKGDSAMVAAILDAWQEQGIPQYVSETVAAISQAFERRDLEPVE